MAFGRDFRKDMQQRLVRADHKSGAFDPPYLLAVHVLFLQHAKLIANFLVYISKECVRQVVLGAELRLCLGCVPRNAQHHRTGRLQFGESIPKAACLNSAARRVGPRIEEQHYGLARVVREAYSLILIGLQREIRNFLIQFHGEIPRMSDGVTINLHYSRAGRPVSSRSKIVFVHAAAACLLTTCAAWSQYPGQITKKTNETPDLRAV